MCQLGRNPYPDKDEGLLFTELIFSFRKFLDWKPIITRATIDDVANLEENKNDGDEIFVNGIVLPSTLKYRVVRATVSSLSSESIS